MSSFSKGIYSHKEKEPSSVAALLLAAKSLNSIAAAMNTLFAELKTVISMDFYHFANLSPSFLRVKPVTLMLSGVQGRGRRI